MDSIEPINFQFHPVLGHGFSKEDFMDLDLSVNNDEIRGLDVVDGLDTYIRSKLRLSDKKVAIGGYSEERDFYWSSPLFKSEAEKRTIHLGVDLWTDPLQPIYAPLDGRVYGVNNNNLPLDYGYTIVLKHSMHNNTFYSLYGHLSDKDIDKIKVGQLITKGQGFCYVGYPETNGGWAPHLHLQMILDMEGNIHDYPGVCTKTRKSHFLQNCPNPQALVLDKSK